MPGICKLPSVLSIYLIFSQPSWMILVLYLKIWGSMLKANAMMFRSPVRNTMWLSFCRTCSRTRENIIARKGVFGFHAARQAIGQLSRWATRGEPFHHPRENTFLNASIVEQ